MKRDIIKQLAKWMNAKDRKPLLITGVRQCGKTYAMLEFGKTYFEDVAYFNFEGNDGIKSVFEYDYNTERMLDELGNVIRGKKIEPGRTLVIFDEIQECPRAITSLKYFCEDMRELHILCAGSLLGVVIRGENVSFPVGKVDRVQMYPMNFPEFLRADGGDNLYNALLKMKEGRSLTELYTVPLEKHLRNYYIVGGMPEVVKTWVETHNFQAIEKVQDNILLDYGSDFSKHAPKSEISKLEWIWESIPKQLAKENNKFIFSHVKEGKRAKDLEDSLEWLKNAGLIYRLELAEKPELPLAFCADGTYFKVYMCDVGLLRRKSGVDYKTILNGAEIYQRFKGALTENYVMTELIAGGIKPYFWRSGNTAEVDFIMEHDNRIVPLEAKSEDNTKAKSYRQFCKRYHPSVGFRFSMRNIGIHNVEETVTHSLPLYMIWKIKDFLEIHTEEAAVNENKELKHMNERELALYMLTHIEEIQRLMDMIEPIIHHEVVLNGQMDKEIHNKYKALKAELKKDAHYVQLKKNQDSNKTDLYKQIVIPSIKEADAWGFMAAANAKIDFNFWGALSEALYRLTKYYSKADWEQLILR